MPPERCAAFHSPSRCPVTLNLQYLVALREIGLASEPTHRKVLVVTRRAHGGREHLAIDGAVGGAGWRPSMARRAGGTGRPTLRLRPRGLHRFFKRRLVGELMQLVPVALVVARAPLEEGEAPVAVVRSGRDMR